MDWVELLNLESNTESDTESNTELLAEYFSIKAKFLLDQAIKVGE